MMEMSGKECTDSKCVNLSRDSDGSYSWAMAVV